MYINVLKITLHKNNSICYLFIFFKILVLQNQAMIRTTLIHFCKTAPYDITMLQLPLTYIRKQRTKHNYQQP
jgi:hypothetical protein